MKIDFQQSLTESPLEVSSLENTSECLYELYYRKEDIRGNKEIIFKVGPGVFI